MSFSLIGKSIGESATLKLNETFAVLKAKGEPVIHLGGGEPKSKAPMEAITSAAAFLDGAEVRYTPSDGTREMKQAVIRYMEQNYGRHFDPENIIVSNGAKQSLMVAMQAILDPQDEILYPSPYWVSYSEMARLIGALGISFRPEDGSFIPRMSDIEQHVSSRTKAIIINSPNNPTGVQYPAELIKQIVAFTESKGIYLIMDDIYHKLLFDGKKAVNVFDFTKKTEENSKIIIINGISKTYAMTGFRIGWAVANKKLVNIMTNIQSHQTAGPSALLQKAATGALNGNQSSVEILNATLENNRNVLCKYLDTLSGVHYTKPDGAFYVFADFSNYEKDSKKLAAFLLDKVKVLVMPGIEFGLEGHLRLSFCGSVKDIKGGMERIKWAIDPNAPNELYIGDRKLVRDWL